MKINNQTGGKKTTEKIDGCHGPNTGLTEKDARDRVT